MAKKSLTLAVLFMFLGLFIGALPMAAQDTIIVGGSIGGPITYNTSTHLVTFTNVLDASQPMTMCSQYNQYGQCQGSPQTYYHTATGSVSLHNITKNTFSGGSDQKTGAAMNATATILADPGDVVEFSESQTLWCPAVGAFVINSSIANWSVEFEGATTKLVANGVGTNDVQPVVSWCSNTSAPDLNPHTLLTQTNPVWTYAWTDTAACARLHNSATSINSSWVCSPGVATRTTDMSLGVCTYNP